jgi:hypothetical protein
MLRSAREKGRDLEPLREDQTLDIETQEERESK